MSAEAEAGDNVNGRAPADKIKSFIAQIVGSEREKQSSADDVKAYYAAAKDAGLNVAALRKCVRYDMMTRDQREKLRESEDTLDLYMQALGFLD